MTRSTETTDIAARQISITRTINAPRELVFAAWTQPEHLINWFGPAGFTNTFIETDIRVDGVWRFIMHGPDGTDYPNLVRFTDVTPPERLTYTHGTGEEPDPHAFEGCVTLEDLGGDQTRLTLTNTFPTVEELEYVVEHFHAIEGGNQTLDKLTAYVESIK